MITSIGWNLERIGAPLAWRQLPDVVDVFVGVVDEVAHGAAVAGVISTVAAGACVQRMDDIDAAIDAGATIINLSWGRREFDHSLKDRLEAAAVDHPEILFVASAGNYGCNIRCYPHYPASFGCPNVVAVAATRCDDELGISSNWDPNLVHLAAPGYIIGALGGTYSGTSYAAAHVSGAAALLKMIHPRWGYAELRQRLMASVDPLPSLKCKVASGGRLNIGRAMETALTPARNTHPAGDHTRR